MAKEQTVHDEITCYQYPTEEHMNMLLPTWYQMPESVTICGSPPPPLTEDERSQVPGLVMTYENG